MLEKGTLMSEYQLDKLTATKVTIGLVSYLLEQVDAPTVVIGYGEKSGAGGFGVGASLASGYEGFSVKTIPAAVSWDGFQRAVRDEGALLGIRIGGVETGAGWYRVCGPDGTEFTQQLEEVLSEAGDVGYCPSWVQGEWFLPMSERLSA